jgi:hypothetical protein
VEFRTISPKKQKGRRLSWTADVLDLKGTGSGDSKGHFDLVPLGPPSLLLPGLLSLHGLGDLSYKGRIEQRSARLSKADRTSRNSTNQAQ